MKIAWLSDFDFRSSGYFNISCALATVLSERGHEVKAIGMGYSGEEHFFPFSIIPCPGMRESFAMIANLKNLWGFDVLIVAMDIPVQEQYVNFNIQNGNLLKYVGIMPIEADPLCMSWALVLMQMNKAMIISKFGTDEARKVGVDAEYLPVGIDTNSWRVPTEEERSKLRSALGFGEDYVVLTVAYNQERKFLSRSMEIFAEFSHLVPNSKYALVTAEQSPVGWKLRDLAQELGISDKVLIFERGMEFKKLWGIYAASDAFLLTSKAEGFGMILMEAMSVGLPCVGTNSTGIKEMLSDGRGYLIDCDYTIRDPFGNGTRYYANIQDGAIKLLQAYNSFSGSGMKERNLEYVKSKTWEQAAIVLEQELLKVIEVTNEQEKQNQENTTTAETVSQS